MKKLKILAVLFVLVTLTNVHAALQSRPGVKRKDNINAFTFFELARAMEAEGGALGLNAAFARNATTGEYEEITASNNIDMHMVKNTEWGTVAMLSASDYGAGNGNVKYTYNSTTNTYDVTASTTGNMTGVFGLNGSMSRAEFTAGGIRSRFSGLLKGAATRYIDNYADSTDSSDLSRYIPGDATYETKTFHKEGVYFVRSENSTNYGLIFERGDRSVFAASNNNPYDGHDVTESRGVVWVGEGL